jgi:hypothetical protein
MIVSFLLSVLLSYSEVNAQEWRKIRSAQQTGEYTTYNLSGEWSREREEHVASAIDLAEPQRNLEELSVSSGAYQRIVIMSQGDDFAFRSEQHPHFNLMASRGGGISITEFLEFSIPDVPADEIARYLVANLPSRLYHDTQKIEASRRMQGGLFDGPSFCQKMINLVAR